MPFPPQYFRVGRTEVDEPNTLSVSCMINMSCTESLFSSHLISVSHLYNNTVSNCTNGIYLRSEIFQ